MGGPDAMGHMGPDMPVMNGNGKLQTRFLSFSSHLSALLVACRFSFMSYIYCISYSIVSMSYLTSGFCGIVLVLPAADQLQARISQCRIS